MMSSRTLALRSVRTQIRAGPRTRIPGARFNSAQSGPNSSRVQTSHIAAGLAGGGVVFLSGCLWYYFYGKHQAVAPARPSNKAISYLRGVAKSYVAIIPGASGYVDSTFDLLEDLHNLHREDIDTIIWGAYNDIRGVVEANKSSSSSALAILRILGNRTAELGKVLNNMSSDAVAPILKRHPKFCKAIGSSWGGFKDLGYYYGSEANKIYNSTTNKIINTVSGRH